MGLFTTENQDTIKDVLKAFQDAAYANYGSHSFAAGYLESVIVSILPLMPKRQQKVLINDMIRATQKQEAEAVKKIKEAA